MTWYKRKEESRAGAVTAYQKPSGRHITVPVENQHAKVPHDDENEPIDEDFLAESDAWEEDPGYEPEETEEKEASEENKGTEEEAPGLEDADLSEVPYSTLQSYAGEYDDVNGNQSREELEEALEKKRSESETDEEDAEEGGE